MPLNTSANGTTTTVVSVPPGAGAPHAYLFNNGPNPAWLGGAGVSTSTGFQVPGNNRVDLSTAGGTIWAIAGGNSVSPSGTVTSATTIGGTALLGSYGTASPYTGGMTIIVEAGTARQEIATIASQNAGTVNVNAAFTFGHPSASVFSQYTPQVTTLQVTRGTT